MRKPPVCASERALARECESEYKELLDSFLFPSLAPHLASWHLLSFCARWSANVTVHPGPWAEPEALGTETPSPLGEAKCPGTRLSSGVSFAQLVGVRQGRVSEQAVIQCQGKQEGWGIKTVLLSPGFWPRLVRCQAARFSAQEVGKGSALTPFLFRLLVTGTGPR